MNKTLEKLKEYIESGAYKYSGPVIGKEEVQMCMDALEKQIFKFVECKGWNGHSGTRYKCPTCKKIIRCGYEYCSNCGQAVKFPKTKLVDGRIVLDWSGIDDN